MRFIILIILQAVAITATFAQASLPIYLDDSKPMKQRIEDALSRMTLD